MLDLKSEAYVSDVTHSRERGPKPPIRSLSIDRIVEFDSTPCCKGPRCLRETARADQYSFVCPYIPDLPHPGFNGRDIYSTAVIPALDDHQDLM